MTPLLKQSLDRMIEFLSETLGDKLQSVYLFGSVTLDDFRPGWSDIDILCLTDDTLSEEEAEKLVNARQTLMEQFPDDPFVRSFEGWILSAAELVGDAPIRAVYWGTKGQKVTQKFTLDVFSRYELIRYGVRVFGPEIRHWLTLPDAQALADGVREHYETIRKYAQQTGTNLYACGWLLDIARCIYTLRTGDVIAKTAAGEWALRENICPDRGELERTLTIRQDPQAYKNKPETKEWLSSLVPCVQRFADVLEQELAVFDSAKKA